LWLPVTFCVCADFCAISSALLHLVGLIWYRCACHFSVILADSFICCRSTYFAGFCSSKMCHCKDLNARCVFYVTSPHRPGISQVYNRDRLLALYTRHAPAAAVVECIRSFGLYTVCCMRYADTHRARTGSPPSHRDHYPIVSCYRGRRAGRSQRSSPVIQPNGRGAFILVANSPSPYANSPSPHQSSSSSSSSLIQVHLDRHPALHYHAALSFGCLNIRSVGNKLDDLLEVRRDQLIDVMFLVETWHDSESVSMGRLRMDG